MGAFGPPVPKKPKRKRKRTCLKPEHQYRAPLTVYTKPEPDAEEWYRREPAKAYRKAQELFYEGLSSYKISKETSIPKRAVDGLIYGPLRTKAGSLTKGS